ncbi:abc multidrug transporter B [Hyphodiscus hymeniophilus]|uniref:Abc multidrug transporter B n=1 Tax=Hyphodiscus hymeniophilus TaxID=353542 RepID=A0A9P7B192_9HELO|nr:abc multidrug transporter B [Hyphodiscus hymeniophilus]
MLAVESQRKTSCLKPEYQCLPPESTSGIINRSLLWWLNSLFRVGLKGIISQDDLFELDSELKSDNVGRKLREAWEKRTHPEGRFTLTFTLWRALRRAFGSVVLPRLCLIGFTFGQPFLISKVLNVLVEADDAAYGMRAYGLIAATCLIYVGIAISSLLANHNLFRFITMFRGGMVSLIYERTLTLREGGVDDSSAVSLMSNDVDQIAFGLEELNEVWSRLIEIAIGVPLLTLKLGWVSVIPLVVVFLSSGGASMVAKLIGDRQKSWADATQRRVTITSSMLKDMKGLKMMGFTGIIDNIVQDERVRETVQMEAYGWINVWLNVVANVPEVIAPAATFGVYAIQAAMLGSETLNTVQAFTSLALIKLVSYPSTRLLAALPNLAASIGCLDRVQDFLLAEPRTDGRLCSELPHSLPGDGKAPIGKPSEAVIPMTDDELAIRIDGTSIRPAPGAENVLDNVSLNIMKGSLVMITGPVGCGKTTLLKAILGEVPCNEGTVYVHSKQMAYWSQSPWLQNVSIRQTICGTMEEKSIDEGWYETVLEACALTHDISRFSAGDQMVVGSRGISLSGGQQHRLALARAIYARPKIFILDDVLSALDKETEKYIVRRLFGDSGIFAQLGATVLMVTHATQYLHLARQIISISPEGRSLQTSPAPLKPMNVLVAVEDVPHFEQAERIPRNVATDLENVAISDEQKDLARQSGDIQVYKYYFKSIGIPKFLLFVSFCILFAFCGSFSGIWLKWWSQNEGRDIGLYLSVYFLLGFGYCVGNGGYGWAIEVVIGPDTGRKLHHILLQTVLKAPLSLFTGTETGSLLNRFSQDMSLIEKQLAIGVLCTFSNLIACVFEASLIVVGSPFITFTIPLFLLAVYLLQKVYLQTSRQLRVLDIETRTPVYSYFLETIEGLATIRGFGWEEKFKSGNHARLDNSQRPYYLLFCIQRWLALVLDLLIAAMAVLAVALALSLRKFTSPGLLGVSMNNILSFNVSLSQFMTGWTLLETSLGAIARLRDFEKETHVEAKEGEDFNPHEKWPSRGLIEFHNVAAAYDTASPALQGISFIITPGQKLAICGRTGSGKSTLLSTILRILDISSGIIKIDSLDLSTIPRTTIRERLITVPQHSIQIPGSIRLNIDPFGQRSDEDIISALTKVQLWSVMTDRGGLDAELQLDWLSKGQQQQLGLARAILRNSAVVLLDEVTSNIDANTARILKDVIKEEFKDSTVIIVAHRPETILDADVVAVLDSGTLVEFGVPSELMKKESRLKYLLEHVNR